MNQQNQVIARQNRAINRLRRHLSRIPEVCQGYHSVPTVSSESPKRQIKTEAVTTPTSLQLQDILSTEDWIQQLKENGWTIPDYIPTDARPEPTESSLMPLAQWWTDHTRGSDPLGVVLGEQAHPEACTRCGTAAQENPVD